MRNKPRCVHCGGRMAIKESRDTNGYLDCRPWWECENCEFKEGLTDAELEERGYHKTDRPVVTLAKPGSECVMVLSNNKRWVAAILIPEQIHIGQIEHLYAIGKGTFRESVTLATMWDCWAVLCDPEWGHSALITHAPRPHGAKFFFVS